MEHQKCKEVRQTTLQFRCEKIPHAGKSGEDTVEDIQIRKSDEKQDHGFSLQSPTPEKIIQPPRTRKSKEHNYHYRKEAENSKMLTDTGGDNDLTVETCESMEGGDASVSRNVQQNPHFSIQSFEEKMSQLSEKYKVIGELFHRMIISVRLLGLQKRLASFQNVSTLVEILAKKKFMLTQLAQMKYLFPEAVHIERILIYDTASLCMKPDIKISLILDATKGLDDSRSREASYVGLYQGFYARLLDFLNTHPEGSEIPKASLPDSFNQGNPMTLSSQLPVAALVEQLRSDSVDDNLSLGASHLWPSFSGHFSQRILVPEKQMTEQCNSSTSMISIDHLDKCNEEIQDRLKNDCPCPLPLNKPPAEMIFSPSQDTCSHFHQGTPVKLISTPVKLMTETPALSPPKRRLASPDVKLVSQTMTPNNSARRSLIYSPSKSDRSGSDAVADITDSLCYKIPCSEEIDMGKSFSGDGTKGYCSADPQMAEENMAVLLNLHDLSEIGFNKRRQMLTSLPELFNTVSFIFSSKNCSSITKQELSHKILSYNCDIGDTGEVEEQLQLLEELVPDWICGKTMSSGDFMYSISRTSDLKSIRARLIEAV